MLATHVLLVCKAVVLSHLLTSSAFVSETGTASLFAQKRRGLALPGARPRDEGLRDERGKREFRAMDAVDEAMWRRVRSELYGGPDAAPPKELERFEAHCEFKRSVDEDRADGVDLEVSFHLLRAIIKEEHRCQFVAEQFPNLTASATWDVENDPRLAWLNDLAASDHFAKCRDELLAAETRGTLPWQEPYKEGWGQIPLSETWSDTGELMFPEAVKALMAFNKASPNDPPRFSRGTVARQTASSKLRRHSDKQPWSLSTHLPLDGPENGEAYMITFDNKTHPWLPGKPLVFDTTFYHSAANESPTKPVYMLYLDIFHPDLTHDEINAIYVLQRHMSEAAELRATQLNNLKSQLEKSFMSS